MKIESLRKLNPEGKQASYGAGIPDSPGVYFFMKGKEILYVGKATSLRDRVRSYMSKGIFDMRGPVIEKMAEEANKIDWKTTDSVLEAIILEANLIKKHQPKYNTKEKSDKSFNYVVITKESLPKVLIIRGKSVKHRIFDKIYGPYPNGSQLKEAMKIIRRIFPFLDDKSKNYYKFYKQVDLVPDISSDDGIKQYKKNIKNLKLFFEGKKKKVLKNLEKEMLKFAKNHEFEHAGEIKRQIFALKHINDVALLKQENFSRSSLLRVRSGSHTNKNFPVLANRIEAYDIAHMGGKNMVGVMIAIENGEIVKDEYRKFKIRTQNNANDTGALTEVLERRLAHREWDYPNLIVVDGGIAQMNVAKRVLRKAGLNITVVSVVKDERHKPKNIMGDKEIAQKYEREILLANSEAHRFAINYHKNMRNKNFLK